MRLLIEYGNKGQFLKEVGTNIEKLNFDVALDRTVVIGSVKIALDWIRRSGLDPDYTGEKSDEQA
jgi:hypothetical protein